MNVEKQFAKYVSQNILGMVGMSLYVIADTYFISLAVGAKGITALNLVLPIYSLIFAIGAMIGVGSAIRFAVNGGRKTTDRDKYFFNALFWGTLIGLVFSAAGLFFPERVISLMGGDSEITAVGSGYTRIFMSFAPFFIWNHICNAFVRNDGAPSVSMAATLSSSLFNIAADYILMFPLGMGMEGAALATALSPLIGVLVCCKHFTSKKCTVKLTFSAPSLRRLKDACMLGISSFVGEISSGVTTAVFNGLILSAAGNTGVAAYGVIANCSMVAASMFNGIAQGSQPIASKLYGDGNIQGVKKVVKLSAFTAAAVSAALISAVYFFTKPIAGIFNSENDPLLAAYAESGLRLYFPGFIFAGLNIAGAGLLSAVEAASGAFAVSVSRGFVFIIPCALIMSALWGLTGVWLSFAAAELITLFITVRKMKQNISRLQNG
ncbi:MAG: MATE family efflux transporter [Oscillospiraceae bacterium]|nr:MATE family efflux transporter [Oscillospiraceae bacterium]MDY6208959.1 MATE family efflux transporter [Oscillospiraceae bacterium]